MVGKQVRISSESTDVDADSGPSEEQATGKSWVEADADAGGGGGGGEGCGLQRGSGGKVCAGEKSWAVWRDDEGGRWRAVRDCGGGMGGSGWEEKGWEGEEDERRVERSCEGSETAWGGGGREYGEWLYDSELVKDR